MRLFLSLFAAISVSASPLVVTATGTFSSDTPVSTFSQPGGTWSLAFDTASNPSVSAVSIGNGFDASYSDFSLTVNGSPVTASVADIRFFSSSVSGLFSICFTSACPGNGIPTDALVFEGPQVYSSSEASPTILPGLYDASLAGVLIDNNPYILASESPVSISSAPEPSVLVMLGVGLSMLGLARKLLYAFQTESDHSQFT